MKIYIASFFDTREKLRPYRDKLWKMGHEVVSTWLDEIARPPEMTHEEFFKKLAIKDLAEIKSCDLIIVDTSDITPRGGREVELGCALGQYQSKLFYLVGPKRNIFHELADKQFPTWDGLIEELERMKSAVHTTNTTGIPTANGIPIGGKVGDGRRPSILNHCAGSPVAQAGNSELLADCDAFGRHATDLPRIV